MGFRRLLVRTVVVLALIAVGPPLAASLFGYGAERGMLPPRGQRIDIGSGEFVNVVEMGQGPAVVLIHGLPSSAYDWAGLPAKLAALGHRVITYDRVGYGFSSRENATADNYSYESNARELGGLLAALDLPAATLVGWSYGGAVAQTFARQWPEKVSGLVLIASVGPAMPKREDPLDEVIRSPAGLPLLTWVASIPPLSRLTTADSVAKAFTSADAVPKGWVDYTRAMLALPGTLKTFVLEAQRGKPKALDPAHIETNAVVIHGDQDQLIPVQVARDLDEKLPNSHLLVIEGGSHMLPVTHPDLLATEIHAFMTN